MEILHSIVAKLLWAAKMVNRDIDPTISLLCARVTKITKEDKEKLRLLMQYLNHTMNDKRIMEADSISPLCTWFDVANGVHL